ncbi:hypothetical protein AB834_03415 [PVC group bacterium (ex Bugula neritina AB1)]|nr:hypothetical protein AB834_03415 [PVC group bacterium (ex Bugula neritina AB1)]
MKTFAQKLYTTQGLRDLFVKIFHTNTVALLLIYFALCFFLKGIPLFSDVPNTNTSFVKNFEVYTVKIAKTSKERKKGLMGVSSLKPNEGMLFIFKKMGHHSFWMKNTLVPLDILWMDNNKKVVHIVKNATPKSLMPMVPQKKALYVLEVLADEAQQKKFSIGDTLIWDDLKIKDGQQTDFEVKYTFESH